MLAPPRDQGRPRSSDDDKEPSPLVDSAPPLAIETDTGPAEPPDSKNDEEVVSSTGDSTKAKEDDRPPVSTETKEPAPAREAAAVPELVSATGAEEKEAEPDLDAIPVLSDALPDQERFEQFRAWLEAGGARYEVWAQDCIFVAASPPFLHLEFAKGFRLKHVSFSVKDERLLRGVRGFFPGCTQVKVKDRDESTGRLTHREHVAKEVAEAQLRLEQLIRDDADIKQIVEHFDGSIRSVHADHRSPVPPALLSKED